MKPWMKIAIPVAIIVVIAAWYAFRPERLVVNHEVNEAPPAAAAPAAATQTATSEPIESGMFYSILHPTKGTATIIQMPDGSHVLRFTDFSTSNGPDVHVYMVASDDAKDVATVQHAGFIDLGPIKGNIGDQNYTLASDLDLSKYRAVSIWCKRFSVNFGAAALKPANATAATSQPIESGMFYSILHPTKGTATIIQMPDGSHVLRFTDFSTSNGPDVHVYMVASDDAKDVATVQHAGFIDLGPIKGNIGDQNYTLASDVDLSKYRAVSIWCKRFSVNFGAAALKPTAASGTPAAANSEPVAVGDAKASQSSR